MIEETKSIIGRPSLGITKKVSITLTEEDWKWLESKAQDNNSQFFRKLVWDARSPESEWSNDACLGYAMLGAAQLYNGKVDNVDERIEELVRAIHSQFDTKSVDQAKRVYREELDWMDA